ncbi:MAG: leucine--tRNA ligase [Bacteroidetes bacterium]|nr:MAG: leucine--tRNA ligase [Bacteroidota bacterium]
MSSYDFHEIEKKWQKYWTEHQTYHVEIDRSKPKYYVLDMFPYPSGAGLHVGHPLGYIASDILARYKRLKGFNVLHPMGYDSFGLPAEQYAIQTGQHPAVTTEKNIKRYREQLDKIGFSFDWSREVKTSDPQYYKWTQWIFLQFFNAWYNNKLDKAQPIHTLIETFNKEGNISVDAATTCKTKFTAREWQSFSEKKQQEILLEYRLAYLAETTVNWCPELGTVLANDEVKDGLSIRGGYPVVQKKMKQWIMRITAYAERLLKDLEKIDWPEPIKEIQRNWIGKSEGALVHFRLENGKQLDIFTTRPDTILGVSFMVLAPEHELVEQITSPEQKEEVKKYIEQTLRKTERDRISNTKSISGVFTGAYAIHPFTKEKIPVWISDYVLAGYGTGAVMAVPAHDSRDYAFAKHFNLPIKQVVEGGDISSEAYEAKEGKIINSGFLNGLEVKQAIRKAIEEIEKQNLGERQINYRLRDAVFSRQRYWGEPIPVYYKEGVPYPVDEQDLPLKLPEVDKYLPTETGEPPLARAKNWTYKGFPLETNTMPGWAGSSWYYLRYEDPKNDTEFVGKEAVDYWQNVDFYVGGAEHATGHLLYFRFWTKFLYDLGYIPFDEPAKKLINQGMIQGISKLAYRLKDNPNCFVSFNLKDQYETIPIHVDVSLVNGDVLDIEKFKQWRDEFQNAEFILEDGKFICGSEVEKMSKSKFNVVNPDDLIEEYGADTLRLYEMFLGPIEQHKPWDTKGIEGTHRFLKKLWRLFHPSGNFEISEEQPSNQELKILHKTLKKVTEDIERFSLNTVVSEFMICVNELSQIKCNKRDVLEPLVIAISPYVPHIAEELWQKLGYDYSITQAPFPAYDEKYLQENTHVYPVSFNGKMRFKIELPVELSKEQIEKEVLSNEQAQKWLQGKSPKKVIVVPKKIVNVVV